MTIYLWLCKREREPVFVQVVKKAKKMRPNYEMNISKEKYRQDGEEIKRVKVAVALLALNQKKKNNTKGLGSD